MTCEAIRLGRILGLPCIWGSSLVGHVEKAVPDEEGRMLAGFIIRRGLGSARWADRSAVGVLGDVSVILSARPCHPPKGPARALGPVKDESGLTLGRVTDCWISREDLTIIALEITLGPAEDLLHGRCRVSRWTVRPTEEGMTILLPREEWERR